MKRFFNILTVYFLALPLGVIAQQTPIYSHYFTNPVLVNPSFTGSTGYSELSVNYRNQWIGIDGAPSTVNAILQLPLNRRISMGLNLLSDSRGALTTYESAMMTSYHLPVGDGVSVDFGLQLGVGRNNIEFNGADLAIDRALENSWYATGAFGMNLTIGRLKVAFALPELFENDLLNETNFEELGLDVTEQTLTSVSYEFQLSPDWTFEPFGLLRTDKEGMNQWETAAIVNYRGIGWIGATYREENGIGGLLGLNVNNWLQFAYAYESSNAMISGFGNGSHEIQLNIRIGKQNKRLDTQKLPLITSNEKENPEETTTPLATSDPENTSEISETELEAVDIHETLQEAADEVRSVTIEYSEPDSNEIEGFGMDPGYYVVVGAFTVKENAERYNKAVSQLGYTSSTGYSSKTGFNYVYILKTSSKEQARQTTLSLKKINTLYFPEAWVLYIKG